jgi:DNA anti-recombination protein RmuC
MPRSVREALGEQASSDLATWLDERREQTVKRDELREVLSRLDVLESEVEQINERFDRMSGQFNERFDRMNEQFNERFEQMNRQSSQRFDKLQRQMRVQTRWTVGPIVIIGAILSALLSIAEFT